MDAHYYRRYRCAAAGWNFQGLSAGKGYIGEHQSLRSGPCRFDATEKYPGAGAAIIGCRDGERIECPAEIGVDEMAGIGEVFAGSQRPHCAQLDGHHADRIARHPIAGDTRPE